MSSTTRFMAVLTANAFSSLFGLIAIIGWLLGFVLAKGFWSTLCCAFPFYAWYLVVERSAYLLGFLKPLCN